MKKKYIFLIISVLVILALCAAPIVLNNKTNGKSYDELETEPTYEAENAASDIAAPSESEKPVDDNSKSDLSSELDDSEEVKLENIAIPEDTSEPIIVEANTSGNTYTDLERYNSMSGEEQSAFIDSFGSPEAFIEWYNNAVSQYESSRNDILIDGSTNIEFTN